MKTSNTIDLDHGQRTFLPFQNTQRTFCALVVTMAKSMSSMETPHLSVATLVTIVAVAFAIWQQSPARNSKLNRLLEWFPTVSYRLGNQSDNEDDKRERFLNWFQDNGGWVQQNLSLTAIPGFGNGLWAEGEISNGSDILMVPKKIQISRESVLQRFSGLYPRTIKQFVSLALMEDEIIALKLLIESCLGEKSFYYPFLSILPTDVPLLFTFRETELSLLDDVVLSELAKQTSARFHSLWPQLEPMAHTILRGAMKEVGAAGYDASCLTQSNFERFFAISSSHSMILDGKKYVAPMADTINHRHRSDYTEHESFHHRDPTTGSIAVRTDRTTREGSQLWEEYSRHDNSLYLVAFGFVPIDNPHHCATLRAKHFGALPDSSLEKILHKLDPSWASSGAVCVHRDGRVLEPVPYLSLHHLQSNPELRQHCVDSGDNQERIREACLSHNGKSSGDDAELFQKAAQNSLHVAESTLEQDFELLAEAESTAREGIDTRRAQLAIRFRIEEKKLLAAIAGG